MTMTVPRTIGLDFGTTNTVAALPGTAGEPALVRFEGGEEVFRTALCFWHDEEALAGRGGVGGVIDFRGGTLSALW